MANLCQTKFETKKIGKMTTQTKILRDNGDTKKLRHMKDEAIQVRHMKGGTKKLRLMKSYARHYDI